MHLGRLSNLAITHANDRYLDGAGAQLQRIYSIYALSRFFDISYVHSPIQKIGYYGLAALEQNETTPQIIARYNEVFTIPSDVEVPSTAIIHHLVRMDLDFLCDLRDRLKKSDEFHLIKLIFPDPLINHHAQSLYYIKDASCFERPPSSLFRVAIHVRRGDLFVTESERMLPNAYYIDIVCQAVEILNKLHIPFCCELYTELPSKPFVVTTEHHGLKNFSALDTNHRIQAPVPINPEENCIEEFDILPNLKKVINGDPVTSMQSLATADLLIISRSCFSYVPALLNKKGIIVFHPFWHPSLPEWLDSREEHFYKQLEKKCEQWKINQEQS
ncbi:MAG: hypothetical protein K2W99_08505 [Chthoniobacterales bacterium]|nr:hypothetical protein [Chthoniobacterales bacterium]